MTNRDIRPEDSVYQLQIADATGERSVPMVTIRANGVIEYGPDYTPDAAAKLFWEAISRHRLDRSS